jgi:hypothetical protein
VSRVGKLICVIGAVGATAVSVAALGIAVAQANTSVPRITAKLIHDRLSVGARPQLHYRVAGEPRGSVLLIQARGAGGWKTDASLPVSAGASGTWTGSAASRGRFLYRALVEVGSRKLATSSTLTLYVYGAVPLSAILGTKVVSVTVNGESYAYAWKAVGWESDAIVQISATSCRSLHLTMAYTQNGSADVADVATLLVIQEARTVAGNVASGTIGTVEANVAGAFEIALQNAPGHAYGNGTASCWSPNGHA